MSFSKNFVFSLPIVCAVAAVSLEAQTTTTPTTSPSPSDSRRIPPPATRPVTRPARAATDRWQVPPRDVPLLLRLFSFQSDILRRPVSYTMYFPPDYFNKPQMRYPVIYMLPSVSGDCRDFGRQAELLDQLIRDRSISPMLIVGVQGVYGSFYVDAKDGKRPIESVIVKEMIARIDNVYRTIPDREHRGIEGFSMGAWGAAHLAFKYPELFGSVSLISPPVGPYEFFAHEFPGFTQDVWANDQTYFDEGDPYLLVAKNADQLRNGQTKIRIYGGDADRFYVTIDDLHKRLDDLKIAHEYRIVPRAGHNLNTVFVGVRDRIFAFWKESFGPPFVPPPLPATTRASAGS